MRGLHAQVKFGLPMIGLIPAGLPSHEELFTAEEFERLSMPETYSLSSRWDFITASVGDATYILIVKCDPGISLDPLGLYSLPSGTATASDKL